MHPLKSLVACGTKLWLDSVDPELVTTFFDLGATGATSNPVIVSDLIATGRFDEELSRLALEGLDTAEIAWALTDNIVAAAQRVFLPVFETTGGDDGYVSFELDPLIEDGESGLTHAKQVRRYVELGLHYSAGNPNRMIKVPATPAGLAALGPLTEQGVPLNVTLIFSMRQYLAARDAIWNAAVASDRIETLKSVYSIFVSRIDIYTEKHCPQLSAAAQGLVGIVNAQLIWQQNQDFWADKNCPLKQEIVFASTGTKKPSDAAWKYVSALAGSDIQTNPPATNEAVANSDQTFTRQVDQLPTASLLDEIRAEVDPVQMEEVLMREGMEKFCTPQKRLLSLIAQRQEQLSGSTA